MDVVTAFLNEHLDEEIYMEQPEGFVKPGEEHLVCKLKRSIYGIICVTTIGLFTYLFIYF